MYHTLDRSKAKEVTYETMEQFMVRLFMHYPYHKWHSEFYDIYRCDLDIDHSIIHHSRETIKNRAMRVTTDATKYHTWGPSRLAFHLEYVDYKLGAPIEVQVNQVMHTTYLIYYYRDYRHLSRPVIREDDYDLTNYLDRWILTMLRVREDYRPCNEVELMLYEFGIKS
jgi:hypothetical protein